jgi:hypothetical protein
MAPLCTRGVRSGLGHGADADRPHLFAYLQHVMKAFEKLEQLEVFGEDVVVDRVGGGLWGTKDSNDKRDAGCEGEWSEKNDDQDGI